MPRTQVAIVGAGPAGLLLAQLLHLAGIESVVLERRSREYVEARVRAGVLEDGAARILREAGVGARLEREGLAHRGIHIQFGGARHHLDFVDLAGRGIVVYGQQEVVKDLIAARLATGRPLQFEAEAITVLGVDTQRPTVRYLESGREAELRCDFVAGCDGSHGPCRQALGAATRTLARDYPFAWLGVLAATPPAATELIYACHERGFALQSMRSPEISRLYLQVDPDDRSERWPPARLWPELRDRLGAPELAPGELLERSVTPMRALVLEPMRRGRLFLAGDAAHVVPPTGAKGMNLALGDVRALASALEGWYETGDSAGLDGYSGSCLRRVWRAQRFSAFMTGLLHRDPGDDAFAHRLRLAHLDHVVGSRAAATALAEDYTGAATD
ncbi:MAG: 4-hydroxybenzoate 3-monooxygenase [Candidatus Dormibacteraeota bacterium]|nr:4-hydroxybenzoate 3-monooxygenase [Candidatus Dormibacteraeota bacterium]